MNTVFWEMHERPAKMGLTTNLFNNVLQSSGFTSAERLVREAVQNSTDATKKGAFGQCCVRFRRFQYAGERKAALKAALRLDNEVYQRRNELGLPENNALENIYDDQVPLHALEISDYNTCGLGGLWNGTSANDHFGRLVINLGLDDKANVADVSGGSFGFGKTVYAKASKIGIVIFYSVFDPTEASENVYARFMATGFFAPHDVNGKGYSGFAFLGEPTSFDNQQVQPVTNEDAHKMAEACGLERRDKSETGTTIAILDCTTDIEEMSIAAEEYWWPRIVEKKLDIAFSDAEREIRPRPKSNESLKDFIHCWSNVVSDTDQPPYTSLRYPNRMSFGGEQMVRLGAFSAKRCEQDSRFVDRVALIRQPGMVVNYTPAGSEAYESCVAIFVGHTDVEKILTYSEPQLHHEWDPHADRLLKIYGEPGSQVISRINSVVQKYFRDFEKKQEPPMPETARRPKELMKLLGSLMATRGNQQTRPPTGPDRPVSIHVKEGREATTNAVRDWAEVKVALADTVSGDTPVKVDVLYEVLGDASHRVLERRDCTLTTSNGEVVGHGAPASVVATVSKDNELRFYVTATSDKESSTRFRVFVEPANTADA